MSKAFADRSLRQIATAGHRPLRKRSPVFPGTLLDQALVDFLAKAAVPLSAYDLAALLQDSGRHMAVMSIYRSLDRLCRNHTIEKVETLSAYRVKDVPKAILMICASCGQTHPLAAGETHDRLMHAISDAGFSPSSIAIEATGLCTQCRT